MVKQRTDPAPEEVEVVVEEEAAAEVEVEEEVVEAEEPAAEKPKAEKPKKPNKLKIANDEIAALKGGHAQVHEILDGKYGNDLTVRSFMQLADQIKGLLPL